MNFRKFALILVAALIPALAASAQENKYHNRAAKDRLTADHSGTHVQYNAQRPSKMDPAPAPDDSYLTSANGS